MSKEIPTFFLCEHGKTLEVILSTDSYYANQITKNIALYLDHDTNEFIGLRIYLGKDYDKVAEALGEEKGCCDE